MTAVLHVRVISPAERADEVVRTVTACEAVTHVVRLPGAALAPPGDCIEFDVAREGANDVLAQLRELGLEESGGVTVEPLDLTMSAAADRAEAAAPGEPDDAVVWAELTARTAAESRMTWAFLVFLTLATQIAAIGALLDQPILIVGAMVLGPEFGPLAALCFAVLRRDARQAGVSVRTLVVGFGVAIVVTLACAVVSRLLGWIGPDMLAARPLTGFIVHPDRWSFIVAVLAGTAGILSMTAGKSSSLIGVFISVTTVPAAGNIAVALALGRWGEVGASFVQLGFNIAGMLVAGVLTLATQRALWSRYGPRLARTRQEALRRGA